MGIKSFELEPTKENLLETLKNDAIGRNQYIYHFVRFCNALDNKCSIAIDARWGNGKTFFVKQSKMVLDAFNPNIAELDEEEKESVKEKFNSFVDSVSGNSILKPQVCVYYDAWANDNDSDPILSLTNEIIYSKAIEYSFGKEYDLKDILKFASPIVKYFTGFQGDELIKLLDKPKDVLDEIKEQKNIHNRIADFFNSLLPEKGERLIIFIDELDRCKPSYAVKLLERIKHFFSNERITFVFSINIEELQHTIKRYYGNEFDACRYLDRFFDFRIELPPADMEKYYKSMGVSENLYYFDLVCREVTRKYSFGLREIEKFYRIVRVTVGHAVDHEQRNTFTGYDLAFQFGLRYIIPIIIGLRMYDIKLYDNFIHGKDNKQMIEILTSKEIGARAFASLLANGETYYQNISNATVVSLQDKLRDVYEAIFANPNRTNEETIVGRCAFTQYTRDRIINAISMLSSIAVFEN